VTAAPVDTDSLPPTQYLVLEVLAARHRTGEHVWTFPSRLTPQMKALEAAGLVGWKSGIVEHTVLAWLTGHGKAATIAADYRPPVAFGRERVARYLDRAADDLRKTGLLSDTVTANAWAEAASWCRDDTIWVDDDEQEQR
jgi:hypothetical protein